MSPTAIGVAMTTTTAAATTRNAEHHHATAATTTRNTDRHYATLYFIVVADAQESDLGILDLIQVAGGTFGAPSCVCGWLGGWGWLGARLVLRAACSVLDVGRRASGVGRGAWGVGWIGAPGIVTRGRAPRPQPPPSMLPPDWPCPPPPPTHTHTHTPHNHTTHPGLRGVPRPLLRERLRA